MTTTNPSPHSNLEPNPDPQSKPNPNPDPQPNLILNLVTSALISDSPVVKGKSNYPLSYIPPQSTVCTLNITILSARAPYSLHVHVLNLEALQLSGNI